MSRPKSSSPSRRSRAAWQALVAVWRKSGLTGVEFGDQHSVDPARLRWWAWYFGRTQSSPTLAAPQPVGPVSIVQLVELPSATDDRIELSLGASRALRFSAAIDPNQLTRLVRAIEGAS